MYSVPRTVAVARRRFLSILFLLTLAGSAGDGAFSQTRTATPQDAALARLQRGYQRLQAKDYETAASALNDPQIARATVLGDYAIYYRAQALAGLRRSEEAEREYLRIATSYPDSLLVRQARLDAAASALARGAYQSAIDAVRPLASEDDGAALKLTADAFEKLGRSSESVAALRRIYFYAPQSSEASEAAKRLTTPGAGIAPASAEDARARADRLYNAGQHALAAQAYDVLTRQFPASAGDEVWLRSGISSLRMNAPQSALAALGRVNAQNPAARSEALYYTGMAQVALRRTEAALGTFAEMRRTNGRDSRAGDLLYEIGRAAERAGQTAQAASLYEQLVKQFPRGDYADEAHFWLAWRAHQAKNYRRAADLLLEHLADHGEVTDNRGKAAFWAAVDAERAGERSRALTLYRGLLRRYSAGWYGVNAERRIAQLQRAGVKAEEATAGSVLARAVASLQGITVTRETAGSAELVRVGKAEQLMQIALYDTAMNELRAARETASTSPVVHLRMAQIFRAQNENAAAINTLRRAYPDYGQSLPEEMTREVWEVFYPLGWWTTIQQEAKRHNIDPYLIAGLIRQETIFNPQARSRANALGLMQLLPSTGRLVARKYSLGGRQLSTSDFYNPVLNIQLGTAYLADMIRNFGRFEYAAAAYNGGPGRVSRWLRELPTSEIEEWVDSIPITETRLYVQGVWRNARHYQRLYDEQGRFRSNVPAK